MVINKEKLLNLLAGFNYVKTCIVMNLTQIGADVDKDIFLKDVGDNEIKISSPAMAEDGYYLYYKDDYGDIIHFKCHKPKCKHGIDYDKECLICECQI